MIREAQAVRYKRHPDFPDYEIGDDGSVWSLKFGKRRQLKQRLHKEGYRYVDLCHNGVAKRRYVHRLVLEAFVGPCPEGFECRHLDGKHTNNTLGNLTWGTSMQNKADQKRHGTRFYPKGSLNGRAKLDESDVAKVHRLRAEGKKQREIAEQLGVSPRLISHVLSGHVWRHVQPLPSHLIEVGF